MEKSTSQSKLVSYLVGFVSSIVLTLVAYILVVNHILSGTALVVAIVALALVQLFVQLFFFLHLGQESSPRWKLITLLFAILVIFIVVGGSLWIMTHLNYNMMHDMDVDQYMKDHQGF